MYDWLTISSRQPIAGIVFCRFLSLTNVHKSEDGAGLAIIIFYFNILQVTCRTSITITFIYIAPRPAERSYTKF